MKSSRKGSERCRIKSARNITVPLSSETTTISRPVKSRTMSRDMSRMRRAIWRVGDQDALDFLAPAHGDAGAGPCLNLRDSSTHESWMLKRSAWPAGWASVEFRLSQMCLESCSSFTV